MDRDRYEKMSAEKEAEFEALCRRCGECCGASHDPCLNLVRRNDGTYFCRGYADRIGPQTTASGVRFTCVPIRQHVALSTLKKGCAYNIK